jgi:hypothetical protein
VNNVTEQEKKYKDYFGPDYYEDKEGSGLGRCEYRWDSKSQQSELEKKFTFFTALNFPRGKLLFVGCAKGYEVRYFRERGHDAYGVDISEYAINECDASVKPFCRVGSIEDLSIFKDNQFSVTLGFDVLQLLGREDRDKATKEIERVTAGNIVARISVRPWYIPDFKDRPDTYDGAPVYLETLKDWMCRFEKTKKFRLDSLKMYEDSLAWFVFRAGSVDDKKHLWGLLKTEGG